MTEAITPISPPVAVAIAVGDLAPIVRPDRLQGQLGVDAAMTSAARTTSSRRQPLVVPTSMYSMNRTTTPLARAKRARSTRPWSLTPA